MMRHTIPFAHAGQSIGLLGGSFDPAHAGHLHISKVALKRFNLDQVWWLVSPGNPLKDTGPAPMGLRMDQATQLAAHPRIKVTDIESQFKTHYTAETLNRLLQTYPRANFTWLMGEDNLAQFHLWRDWQWIASNVPIGVIARPRAGIPALNAPFSRLFRGNRLKGAKSALLATSQAPTWCFINTRLRPESSTSIRNAGQWPKN